jgi:3-(3-hydroxy-phenyl)propionate hydroxylase
MTMRPGFDVAIVGAGPTGVYLANMLGLAGLSVLIADREGAVLQIPRAVHFDGEIMRAFQAGGLADPISCIARASSQGMHFLSASGNTLMIRRGYEGVGPHGWANNYYVHQPHLEAALREGLSRFPTVETRFGHEVREVADNGGHVALTLTDRARSTDYGVTASYAVGCDGARSLVRRTIGSSSEDLGLHQPWLVVDAIVDVDAPRVRALPDYTVQLCDPARPMTMVFVGGRRRRWEIMLMPGDDANAIVEPQNVWPFLSRWITPEDAVLERAAVYTFHSLIASGWRCGRLMLAGDACHQTPPFLGQGMCAGIRDGANLAWKLAAVVRGDADPALLDTYESERRPHVHAFIKLAVELGGTIQTTDVARANERDIAFAAGPPQMFDFPQPQLGSGARVDAPPPVGTIFPQPTLDDGARLDDATAGRFALLADGAFLRGLPDDLRMRLDGAGVAIIAKSAEIETWLVNHRLQAVVIRPDAYIFAAITCADELRAAIARLSALFRTADRSRSGGGREERSPA